MAQSLSGIFKSREMIGYIVAAVLGFLFGSSQDLGQTGGGGHFFFNLIIAYGFAGLWCGFLFMRRSARRRRAAGQIDVNVTVYQNAEQHNRMMWMRWISNFMAAFLLGFFILPVRVFRIATGRAAD